MGKASRHADTTGTERETGRLRGHGRFCFLSMLESLYGNFGGELLTSTPLLLLLSAVLALVAHTSISDIHGSAPCLIVYYVCKA